VKESALARAVRAPYRIATALTGVDVRRAYASARGIGRFVRSLQQYNARAHGAFEVRVGNLYPVLTDFDEAAGTASGHYFHQDLWAARKVYAFRPRRHVDVGSRIDGLVTHLLVFMDVEVVDIRPLPSPVPGLTFVQADGAKLETLPDDSVESLSSLHAVEHFGLGRYGDPVDPQACFSAMRSLARVLQPGGHLFFSVPIGVERVEFNAHRVFAPETVLRSFPSLSLKSFSAVDDGGKLHVDCDPHQFDDARLACGLFELQK
jgi:hypothetical protein